MEVQGGLGIMEVLTEIFGFILLFLVVVYALFGGTAKIAGKIQQKATNTGFGIVLFTISAGSILLSLYGLSRNMGYNWTFWQFLDAIFREIYSFVMYLFKYIK